MTAGGEVTAAGVAVSRAVTHFTAALIIGMIRTPCQDQMWCLRYSVCFHSCPDDYWSPEAAGKEKAFSLQWINC